MPLLVTKAHVDVLPVSKSRKTAALTINFCTEIASVTCICGSGRRRSGSVSMPYRVCARVCVLVTIEIRKLTARSREMATLNVQHNSNTCKHEGSVEKKKRWTSANDSNQSILAVLAEDKEKRFIFAEGRGGASTRPWRSTALQRSVCLSQIKCHVQLYSRHATNWDQLGFC